ncbi:MAG: hypothetical protein LBR83_00940 [Clostridiales bacterium]|nr:hypothetical protein [Clostridiales bacterium]
MKYPKIILLTLFVFTILFCAACSSAPYEITRNGLTCLFDPQTGFIRRISNGSQTLNFDGVVIDVGFDTGTDSAYLYTQAGFFDIGALETWTLPTVYPRKKPMPEYEITEITETENGVNVGFLRDGLHILYQYTFQPDGLRVSSRISSRREGSVELNGVAFITRGLNFEGETFFEYPGNTPPGEISISGSLYRPFVSDYCASATVLRDGKEAVNLIFLDDEEKWGTGVYEDENENACAIHVAGVLSRMEPGEALDVGGLFIQLTAGRDRYAAIREHYKSLGYAAPQNGKNDGPVYSAHPSGTMDTGFTHLKTLTEFAEYLPALSETGIKNVWLLPVFLHPGDSVYESIDQSVIDPRYGGEKGAIDYTAAAHALNMRVLFDYVPHGPRPTEPLAAGNPDWISKTRSGENQIEWECVSFDYNNPEYARYTTELVKNHAAVLGVDGARIDCSMGGLPNWNEQPPYRASSSGISAGINIVRAIREGFESGGKTPMILPENFHPIPLYAEYTDIFYDMPLYRTMYTLNGRLDSETISETEYVKILQDWLWAESESTVEGIARLRFLGNHDTVDWTFDAARPQAVYGTEKAKAMWALMSFIDGVPMIYQGDENPEAYGLRGENLAGFFKRLFTARAEFIPEGAGIEYFDIGLPVFAFRRYAGDTETFALINFSGEEQTVDLPEGFSKLAFSEKTSPKGGTVTLGGYGFALLK